ncbi:MAG: hypothetical protein EU529_04445 [Promethearchaeota archaeon]|nr:MAG: hypothetical protein EU529_04445 [Candidatus Lokiarchaeota archaeon]
MTIHTESYSDILGKYPFSLFEIDGPLDIWQDVYGPYIDSIESKIIISKKNSIKTFRNHNFAFNNAVQQRIADLIINEVEEQISNPTSKSTRNDFKPLKDRIEDQYSDEGEEENGNLKITFVFTNKKIQPLKLIQVLKLTGEVERFAQLLHRKKLKQYSKIIPQIIFISLFGFEASVGDYLKDNLYGKLNRNMSILIVPPIDKKLWNNYFVTNSMKGKDDYENHKSGFTFESYNILRKNGTANQSQIKKMETYYNDLRESKEISEYNSHELNIWADALSIKNSSTLLDVENSRKKIRKLLIE